MTPTGPTMPRAETETVCITGARRCRDEYPRQFSHLAQGVVAGVLILLLPSGLSVMILAGVLLASVLISDALVGQDLESSRAGRFVGLFIRTHEAPGGGANYTGLSVLAALIFFPATAVAVATIAFGVLDSVSTIAGLRYGRRRLPNEKSIEGSIVAIAVTIPVLLIFLPALASLAIASVGALAELVLPVNDNLVVPFLIALLVTAVV